MDSIKYHPHLRRKNLIVFFLFAFIAVSCNRFNQSYNEIPKLPPANFDFTKQHSEVLNKLIEEDDENDELYWQRSVLNQKLGKPKEALEDIKKAIQLDDEKYHYYKQLARAYLLNDKYDSAIRAAEFSRNSGNDDYQLNLILAEAHLNKGEIKESMAEIDEALQIDPNYYYTYYLRGLAYKELKDTTSYKENFLNALSLNPDDKNLYTELLEFYTATNKQNEAREILDKLFANFSADNDMMILKAEFFEKQNRPDSAYAIYSKMIGQDSSLSEVSLKLGNMKFKSRDFSTAIEHFKNVLKVKNDNFEAQYKIGLSYENLRKFQQAIEELEKAQKLDTLNQIIQVDLARIKGKIYYRQQQELERLKQEYEQRKQLLLPELPVIN